MKTLFFSLAILFLGSIVFGLYATANGYKPYKNKQEYISYYIEKYPLSKTVVKNYDICVSELKERDGRQEYCKNKDVLSIDDEKLYDKFIEEKNKYYNNYSNNYIVKLLM